jgi:hypothetical protein
MKKILLILSAVCLELVSIGCLFLGLNLISEVAVIFNSSKTLTLIITHFHDYAKKLTHTFPFLDNDIRIFIPPILIIAMISGYASMKIMSKSHTKKYEHV